MFTKEIEKIVYDLEEFFENAGFDDIYERELKYMNDDDIIRLYNKYIEK